MEITKNKIYKLSEIVEDLKRDYFSKLEKLQIMATIKGKT